MTLGRTLGSSGHGTPPLFNRGQTAVPAMGWKMQKNETSDWILELGKVSFCWLPQDEKKKSYFWIYLHFPHSFPWTFYIAKCRSDSHQQVKGTCWKKDFFFFPADILAVAFSRASLGAQWTPDTAKWQLPLALSTCHQGHDDQHFICPSCQGGCNIFLVIRCETFLQFESTDTTAGINRRHRR